MKDDPLGFSVALKLGPISFETRVKSYLLPARRTGWLVFEHLPWAKTWCQNLYQRLSNYTVPLRSAGDLVTKQIMTQEVWGQGHNLTWAVYSVFLSEFPCRADADGPQTTLGAASISTPRGSIFIWHVSRRWQEGWVLWAASLNSAEYSNS